MVVTGIVSKRLARAIAEAAPATGSSSRTRRRRHDELVCARAVGRPQATGELARRLDPPSWATSLPLRRERTAQATGRPPQLGVGRSSGSGVGSAPSDHLASGVGLLSSTALSLGLDRGFFLSATRRLVTMTDQERRHLAQADRHIAECKALIARQQELVRRIAQRGQPTDWAEDTLRAFESNLRAFEAHRNEIVVQIDAER
jgi:hypothetical protein